MKINSQLSLKRIIAKIDNDFNISESDWIPRVAAWTIDALSQLKCLPMERRKRELEVSERVAIFPCELNMEDLRVFDSNGCEIPNYNEAKGCSCSPNQASYGKQIGVFDSSNKTGVNTVQVANIVNSNGRNFVLDCNKIELNFDTDKIIVESYEVATYHDDYFDCECPYVYDDGLLLEAIAWYCLFKYLSRGSKHQVYDLKSPNPAINPFMQWNAIKSKAATSVKIKINKSTDGWNNFFYNSTFLPRG